MSLIRICLLLGENPLEKIEDLATWHPLAVHIPASLRKYFNNSQTNARRTAAFDSRKNKSTADTIIKYSVLPLQPSSRNIACNTFLIMYLFADRARREGGGGLFETHNSTASTSLSPFISPHPFQL